MRRILHESVNDGFHALNDAWLVLYLHSRTAHVSPCPTTCHLVQSSEVPKLVGAGGLMKPAGMIVETIGKHVDAMSVRLGRIGLVVTGKQYGSYALTHSGL
ncbi:hypothetical protein J1614_010657 [Plenodomus biglobosus]|nr:hypothetical protein J1614_010657 [Plenodomus biglobosus]